MGNVSKQRRCASFRVKSLTEEMVSFCVFSLSNSPVHLSNLLCRDKNSLTQTDLPMQMVCQRENTTWDWLM